MLTPSLISSCNILVFASSLIPNSSLKRIPKTQNTETRQTYMWTISRRPLFHEGWIRSYLSKTNNSSLTSNTQSNHVIIWIARVQQEPDYVSWISHKRPETRRGTNKDTRIDETGAQTAGTEHPRRDLTTLLCTPDIVNNTQESDLSNISVEAEVDAKDAGHKEAVSQVQASSWQV